MPWSGTGCSVAQVTSAVFYREWFLRACEAVQWGESMPTHHSTSFPGQLLSPPEWILLYTDQNPSYSRAAPPTPICALTSSLRPSLELLTHRV